MKPTSLSYRPIRDETEYDVSILETSVVWPRVTQGLQLIPSAAHHRNFENLLPAVQRKHAHQTICPWLEYRNKVLLSTTATQPVGSEQRVNILPVFLSTYCGSLPIPAVLPRSQYPLPGNTVYLSSLLR